MTPLPPEITEPVEYDLKKRRTEYWQDRDYFKELGKRPDGITAAQYRAAIVGLKANDGYLARTDPISANALTGMGLAIAIQVNVQGQLGAEQVTVELAQPSESRSPESLT